MAILTVAVFSIIPTLIVFGDKIRSMSLIEFSGEELHAKVEVRRHEMP